MMTCLTFLFVYFSACSQSHFLAFFTIIYFFLFFFGDTLISLLFETEFENEKIEWNEICLYIDSATEQFVCQWILYFNSNIFKCFFLLFDDSLVNQCNVYVSYTKQHTFISWSHSCCSKVWSFELSSSNADHAKITSNISTAIYVKWKWRHTPNLVWIV